MQVMLDAVFLQWTFFFYAPKLSYFMLCLVYSSYEIQNSRVVYACCSCII